MRNNADNLIILICVALEHIWGVILINIHNKLEEHLLKSRRVVLNVMLSTIPMNDGENNYNIHLVKGGLKNDAIMAFLFTTFLNSIYTGTL